MGQVDIDANDAAQPQAPPSRGEVGERRAAPWRAVESIRDACMERPSTDGDGSAAVHARDGSRPAGAVGLRGRSDA